MAILAQETSAIFFFQDMKPKAYRKNEMLDIHVGQLWNDRSALPFDYYKLHWCKSTKGHDYDP